MRNCTAGKARALSVKTVPRTRKSLAWLYLRLLLLVPVLGFIGVVAGGWAGAVAGEGAGGAGSCWRARAAGSGIRRVAAPRITSQLGRCMQLAPDGLDE